MSHGVAAVLPQPAPRAMTYSIDADGHSTRPWPSQGPEGLLVIGDAHGVGSRVDTQQAAQQVERWVQRHFPGADVHALWCAHDYVTPDRMPYVGTPFGHQNVHVATGFGKWGLTNGAAAALVVQDVLAGREARWRAAMNAGRIGDLSAVAKTVRDNLEIAAELVSGQVLRDTPRCTHLGCRLRWNSADDSWDCPCHGSRFAADGSVLAGPAVRPLDLPK